MKIYKMIESILNRLFLWFWILFIIKHEKKNIKLKKKLWSSVVLTEKEKKQIDDYYLCYYGKKISYKWHKLYKSYSGKFDYKYIPEYLFTTKLEVVDNFRTKALFFEDKNLYDSLFKDIVLLPKTYLRHQKVGFLNNKNEIFCDKDVIPFLKSLLLKEKRFICKPTIDSSSGKNVDLYSEEKRNLLNSSQEFINKYGNNFIIQECIIQNKWLETLHKESVNTIRIMSFITENGFFTTPMIIRMGVGESYVDNAHAGGIYIGVKNDGTLEEYAFTEYGKKYNKHPDSGVIFKELRFPFYEKIIKKAIEIHKRYSNFRFISYDFSIDIEGNVILIEWNLHSQSVWMMQTACGVSAFGEQTEYLLKSLKK